MPLIIAALWGALIEIAGTLVGKVLVSLGIGYAVYTGVDTSITWAKMPSHARRGRLTTRP